MNAQVLLLVEEVGNGVGDAPDAQLDGRPVRDALRDVLADLLLHVGDLDLRHDGEVMVLLHDVVDLAHMDHVLDAVDPGGLGVDLGDDLLALGRGESPVDHAAGAVVHVAALVRRGHLDHGHVVRTGTGSRA